MNDFNNNAAPKQTVNINENGEIEILANGVLLKAGHNDITRLSGDFSMDIETLAHIIATYKKDCVVELEDRRGWCSDLYLFEKESGYQELERINRRLQKRIDKYEKDYREHYKLPFWKRWFHKINNPEKGES